MPSNGGPRFDAFLAAAIGAAAGWFVLNSFGMPNVLLTFIFEKVKGLYDVFRSYTGGEIALISFLYRVPAILFTGLLIGLILPRIRNRLLLLYSILIWPAYAILRTLLFVLSLEVGGREAGRRGLGVLYLQTNAGPEIVVYIILYMLLFLLVVGTSRALRRIDKHNLPLNRDASQSDAPVS